MPSSTYFDAMILRFDGGCRGYDCTAGSGWVLLDVYDYENVVAEGYYYYGRGGTNNIAEYYGLIKGLQFLVDEGVSADRIHIQGDSELVINQMLGIYRVRSPNLIPLFEEATGLYEDLDCDNVKFTYINRGLNSYADRLAGIAIEEGHTDSYWV